MLKPPKPIPNQTVLGAVKVIVTIVVLVSILMVREGVKLTVPVVNCPKERPLMPIKANVSNVFFMFFILKG